MYWEVTAQDAWGKTTAESYLDGTTGVLANYDSSGQARTASWSLHGSVVDSLTYTYDALQRLTSASRSGGTVNYGYSPAGNLRYKDDYSTKPTAAPWAYQYGTQVGSSAGACGPHGAMSVSLAGSGTASYQCDAIGNVIGGSTLSATYDADNHPRTVTRSGIGSTGWAYGADGQRDYESSSEGARYFGASGYEQVGTKQIHELGPIILTSTGGTITGITIALRDRLGSTIDTIDNGAATIANARTYDAFGAVRDGNMNSRTGGTLNLGDTRHGFTQHEHADDVRLIHMGGRIYDYTLGRFLNVDPVIGNPMSSQSLNPYSYIGNNPLSGTDPTGYEKECDASGANCTLTDVQSITVYQSHDGSKFAVATDNAGNQIKAEAITNGSSTGVNGTLLTQGTLNGVLNHDPSTINSIAAAGFGGQSVASGSGFDKNAYDIHESSTLAADYFGGFAKATMTGVALAFICGNSPMAAAGCMAYGAGESAAHDPQGASFIAAGMGGGAASGQRAMASAQGLRGASITVESGASGAADAAAVKPGDTGTYGGLKAQK